MQKNKGTHKERKINRTREKRYRFSEKQETDLDTTLQKVDKRR